MNRSFFKRPFLNTIEQRRSGSFKVQNIYNNMSSKYITVKSTNTTDLLKIDFNTYEDFREFLKYRGYGNTA